MQLCDFRNVSTGFLNEFGDGAFATKFGGLFQLLFTNSEIKLAQTYIKWQQIFEAALTFVRFPWQLHFFVDNYCDRAFYTAAAVYLAAR